MTQTPYEQPRTASEAKLIRIAIWVAIGALIAAALVCVVWVLVGSQNGLVGRAFLTIVLLAAFAGVAILDAHLAARRPAWFALTSMIVWVVTLLIGAFLIWMPQTGFAYGFERFVRFLLIVLVLQLAVLHVRLYMKALQRNVTTFTTIVAIATLALVAILAIMLVIPLAFEEFFRFTDTYWRWVVAFAILAAVGTALLPLVNALFAPRRPRAVAAPAPRVPAAGAYGYAQLPPQPVWPQAWPTYADGVTPLPVLVDGSPDWNAYYTGYPTPAAPAIAAAPAEWAAGQNWTEQQAWPEPQAPAADATQEAWAQLAHEQQWTTPHAPVEPQAAPYVEPQAVWPPAEPEAPVAPPAPAQAYPPAQASPPATPGYQGYPPPPPLPPQR